MRRASWVMFIYKISDTRMFDWSSLLKSPFVIPRYGFHFRCIITQNLVFIVAMFLKSSNILYCKGLNLELQKEILVHKALKEEVEKPSNGPAAQKHIQQQVCILRFPSNY